MEVSLSTDSRVGQPPIIEFSTVGRFSILRRMTRTRTVRKAFAARLVEAMLDKGLAAKRHARSGVDAAELARIAGVTLEMGRRYVSGEALPDPERMKIIADWLGVMLPWLRDGIGAKQSDLKNEATRSNVAAVARSVPRIAWESIPQWRRLTQHEKQRAALEPIVTDANVTGDAFAVTVVGDLMEPDYPDGCLLVVDPALEPKNKDMVIAELNGSRVFRQLVIDGGRSFLKPLNSRYPIEAVDHSPTVYGVVVEALIRKRLR